MKTRLLTGFLFIDN